MKERTLLTLAALGGSPAMIAGQYLIRHKTWKEPFRSFLRAIAVVQAIAAIALCFPQVRGALSAAVTGG